MPPASPVNDELMMSKPRCALIGLLFFVGLAHAQPLSFGLLGDMPYSAWERRTLPLLLQEMDRAQLAFVVHDGDIKSGRSACTDEALTQVRDQFQASMTPLIYVPGDNEWTDCHRRSNGRYDPLERLATLRTLFFSGDHALGQRRLRLQRQSEDPAFALYRENVRWEAANVVFVGLNLPGSENNYHGSTDGEGPVLEFVQRSAANHAWLAKAFALARSQRRAGVLVVIQANPQFEDANAGNPAPGYRAFLTQLREETMAFDGQVVLVHGDSHWQRVDQPMRAPGTRQVVANFRRVETFGWPFFGWVQATVDARDPQLFRFTPRPWRPEPR